MMRFEAADEMSFLAQTISAAIEPSHRLEQGQIAHSCRRFGAGDLPVGLGGPISLLSRYDVFRHRGARVLAGGEVDIKCSVTVTRNSRQESTETGRRLRSGRRSAMIAIRTADLRNGSRCFGDLGRSGCSGATAPGYGIWPRCHGHDDEGRSAAHWPNRQSDRPAILRRHCASRTLPATRCSG